MKSPILKAALFCLAAALFACSSGTGTTALVDSSGNHPAGWVQTHWLSVSALKGTLPGNAETAVALGATPCAECHGKDLAGGISKVSCFSVQDQNGIQCHPKSLGHPSDWGHAIQHGQSGAMAAAGVSSGFAWCSTCHGDDYRGGTGKAVSCFSCHTTAPHPAKPWIGGNLSHATTSPTEAAACFKCHAGGNNFGAVLVSAPAAGSPAAPTPDCFNNTLCHGGQVTPPHVASATYLNASAHGTDAAGENPAKPELGLATCASCHADGSGRFNRPNNNMSNGCETCHAPFTAHPTPWLPARAAAGALPVSPNTTSHAKVPAATLVTQCSPCHGAALDGVGGRGNAPSCSTAAPQFGIRCHATSPAASPTGCTSCHPAFVGSKPATGAHAAHLGLPNIGCQACHSAGGVDSATGLGGPLHANGFVNVSSSAYRGKSGSFSYNPQTGTCANVRCHGGGDPVTHATPAWNGGTLDPTRDCLECHQQGDAGNLPQTPQFNSFYSGNFGGVNLHQFHLTPNPLFPALPATCTGCHALTTAQHFGGLATPNFDTNPGDTISNLNIGSYDKTVGGCSNVACHTAAPKDALWGK